MFPASRPRFAGRMLAVLWILGLAASASGAVRRQPNFLIILGDNLGKDWIGCYGSDEKQTPNIDRLAAGGVRFKTFYVTPLCSTTRVSLLTGRYGFSTGWHTHHDAAFYGGGGLDWRRETTWAGALQAAGYATAIAGKWQINDLYEQRDALRQHGFEEHLVWTGALLGEGSAEERWKAFGSNRIVTEGRYWDPVVFHNGERKELRGRFSPDVFADYLIEFMERNRQRPFVAYYASPLTHAPPVRTPAGPDPGSDRARFAGMVRYLDAQVGRFERELDRLGLRDDTFLIVLTDNGTVGPMAAARDGRPWPGGHDLSEPSLDAPLIVNCPARIPGGRTSEALVDCTDLFPTLIELAGAAAPRAKLDGRSFARQLLGRQDAPGGREWIFSMYDTTRVVRDQRFKLYSTGRFYDVVSDPLEEIDLAASTRPEVEAARQRLGAVLRRLPESEKPPVAFRSSSARRLESERAKSRKGGAGDP